MSIPKIQTLEEAFSAFSIQDYPEKAAMPNRGPFVDRSIVWENANLHRDDIHGIIQLGNSELVSGSKDGSLVKIDPDGKKLRSFQPMYPSGMPDYNRWVTSIARLSSSLWLHGTRDGKVCLWENKMRCRRIWDCPIDAHHISKIRNFHRIMCFGTPFKKDAAPLSFFVGQATKFSLKNMDPKIPSRDFVASENDWIYAIHPMSEQKMLVVTGPNLFVWSFENTWKPSYPLVQEGTVSTTEYRQRPYISSVIELASHAHLIACTFFGGAVAVLDTETKKFVHCWGEHRGRVWSVVQLPLSPSLLATSADDKVIKLWDIRQPRCIFTSMEHVGRVSSLLAHADMLFAATCPNRPDAEHGASLLCRDLHAL